MVLERLGHDGKVVEKKNKPLPALQPTPDKWKSDWDSIRSRCSCSFRLRQTDL